MTYDWDGQRTRRTMALKLMTAVAICLSVTLMVTVWTYVGWFSVCVRKTQRTSLS